MSPRWLGFCAFLLLVACDVSRGDDDVPVGQSGVGSIDQATLSKLKFRAIKSGLKIDELYRVVSSHPLVPIAEDSDTVDGLSGAISLPNRTCVAGTKVPLFFVIRSTDSAERVLPITMGLRQVATQPLGSHPNEVHAGHGEVTLAPIVSNAHQVRIPPLGYLVMRHDLETADLPPGQYEVIGHYNDWSTAGTVLTIVESPRPIRKLPISQATETVWSLVEIAESDKSGGLWFENQLRTVPSNEIQAWAGRLATGLNGQYFPDWTRLPKRDRDIEVAVNWKSVDKRPWLVVTLTSAKIGHEVQLPHDLNVLLLGQYERDPNSPYELRQLKREMLHLLKVLRRNPDRSPRTPFVLEIRLPEQWAESFDPGPTSKISVIVTSAPLPQFRRLALKPLEGEWAGAVCSDPVKLAEIQNATSSQNQTVQLATSAYVTRQELDKVTFAPHVAPPRDVERFKRTPPQGQFEFGIHFTKSVYGLGERVRPYFVVKSLESDGVEDLDLSNFKDDVTLFRDGVQIGYQSRFVRKLDRQRPPQLEASGYWLATFEMSDIDLDDELAPGKYELYWGLNDRWAIARFAIEADPNIEEKQRLVERFRDPPQRLFSLLAIRNEPPEPDQKGDDAANSYTDWRHPEFERVEAADFQALLRMGVIDGKYYADPYNLSSEDDLLTVTDEWTPDASGEQLKITLKPRHAQQNVILRCPLHVMLLVELLDAQEAELEPEALRELLESHVEVDKLLAPKTLTIRLPADWRTRVGGRGKAKVSVVVSTHEFRFPHQRLKRIDSKLAGRTSRWSGVLATKPREVVLP